MERDPSDSFYPANDVTRDLEQILRLVAARKELVPLVHWRWESPGTHLTAGRALALISRENGLLQPVPHAVGADENCRPRGIDRHSAGMMGPSHAFGGGRETDRSEPRVLKIQSHRALRILATTFQFSSQRAVLVLLPLNLAESVPPVMPSLVFMQSGSLAAMGQQVIPSLRGPQVGWCFSRLSPQDSCCQNMYTLYQPYPK